MSSVPVNRAVRDALRVLQRGFPADRQIQTFVDSISVERNALWEAWKQAVPSKLQSAVTRVRSTHNGPSLKQSGTISIEAFVGTYRNTAEAWLRRAGRLESERGTDPIVSRELRRIQEQLQKVDEVLP